MHQVEIANIMISQMKSKGKSFCDVVKRNTEIGVRFHLRHVLEKKF